MDRVLIAGILTLLLSAAHSIIGERLVFARLRLDGTWREEALKLMQVRRWWSIRASWHLVTLFGIGWGVTLLLPPSSPYGVQTVMGATFAVSAVYWAVATRLGHPAWIVLGIIGALLLVQV
jgi:hypothetical protein